MNPLADVTPLAGKLSSISSSLNQLGFDTGALQTTVAAFQLIGGTGQVLRGIIAAKEAFNSAKLAEGMAHLAKWGAFSLGVGAVVVGASAVAGAVAMDQLIDRYINVEDSDGGMRQIAGGIFNGRGA